MDHTPDYLPESDAEDFDYDHFEIAPEAPRRRRSMVNSKKEDLTPAMAAAAGSEPNPNMRPIVPPPVDDPKQRERWADPSKEEKKQMMMPEPLTTPKDHIDPSIFVPIEGEENLVAAERLLRAPEDLQPSFIELKIWALENFIIRTGFSERDILALRNKDLNLYDGSCNITLKSGESITLSLPAALIPVLDTYTARRGGENDDYLFCNEEGEQMSKELCYEQILAYHKARNLSHISPKDLRKLHI